MHKVSENTEENITDHQQPESCTVSESLHVKEQQSQEVCIEARSQDAIKQNPSEETQQEKTADSKEEPTVYPSPLKELSFSLLKKVLKNLDFKMYILSD